VTHSPSQIRDLRCVQSFQSFDTHNRKSIVECISGFGSTPLTVGVTKQAAHDSNVWSRFCPIEDRKALLRQVLDDVGCSRLVYVDHVTGRGIELLEHVRAIGAEGIVSKRFGSRYRGGRSQNWLKTKCHATGTRWAADALLRGGSGEPHPLVRLV
jgi:hypothetical protein